MSWLDILRKAVTTEGSQAAVARKLGYSPTALSQTLGGRYGAQTTAIGKKIQEIYGGKTMQEVPEGYKRNALGHLVPLESIKEIDIARDEFVKSVIAKARDMEARLASLKTEIAGDMQAFLELSAEKYGVDLGGERGNLSLASYDGRYKVMRAVSERLDFDERLQAAKALIDECLREWSRNAGPELRTLVESAFQVDKKGKINARRILSLRSLKIDHPPWKRAMEAIGDAITVVGSCTYYRVYERDEAGNYVQVTLDFSGVA